MTKKSFIENTVRTAHLVLLGSIDHMVSMYIMDFMLFHLGPSKGCWLMSLFLPFLSVQHFTIHVGHVFYQKKNVVFKSIKTNFVEVHSFLEVTEHFFIMLLIKVLYTWWFLILSFDFSPLWVVSSIPYCIMMFWFLSISLSSKCHCGHIWCSLAEVMLVVLSSLYR